MQKSVLFRKAYQITDSMHARKLCFSTSSKYIYSAVSWPPWPYNTLPCVLVFYSISYLKFTCIANPATRSQTQTVVDLRPTIKNHYQCCEAYINHAQSKIKVEIPYLQ